MKHIISFLRSVNYFLASSNTFTKILFMIMICLISYLWTRYTFNNKKNKELIKKAIIERNKEAQKSINIEASNTTDTPHAPATDAESSSDDDNDKWPTIL